MFDAIVSNKHTATVTTPQKKVCFAQIDILQTNMASGKCAFILRHCILVFLYKGLDLRGRQIEHALVFTLL